MVFFPHFAGFLKNDGGRRPRRLAPGDRVGVVAPSGPPGEAALSAGMAALRRMGFETVAEDGLLVKRGYLAGSDRRRAAAFSRMMADPRIHAVCCARGGYGALRMLPHLDFQALSAHAKPVIGFSDITALLVSLYQGAGLVTIHGPVVTTLATADPGNQPALLRALTGDAPISLRAPRPVTLRPGVARGPVTGGNLSTLCHLLGTPFAPVFRNHLALLEDIAEPPYKLDRMLTQMRLAGCFDGVAGVMLGSFTDCGGPEAIHGIVADILGDIPAPMAAGLPVGHGPANQALAIGAVATLDADRGRLDYAAPVTRPARPAEPGAP